MRLRALICARVCVGGECNTETGNCPGSPPAAANGIAAGPRPPAATAARAAPPAAPAPARRRMCGHASLARCTRPARAAETRVDGFVPTDAGSASMSGSVPARKRAKATCRQAGPACPQPAPCPARTYHGTTCQMFILLFQPRTCPWPFSIENRLSFNQVQLRRGVVLASRWLCFTLSPASSSVCGVPATDCK